MRASPRRLCGLTYGLLLMLSGCTSGNESAVGGERGPCFPNGTCNAGLTCLSDVCVSPAADACATNNGGCDANATCADTDGSRLCTCKTGWTGDGTTCADVDECLTANGGCNANTTCTNTDGSRLCTCKTGWTGDGTTCADVDECLTANGGCDANATCTNTGGSRLCTCKTGWTGDGTTCADVDECLTANGGCDALTECTNTPGSRTCGACPTGYTGSGTTGCVDIDECATANGGCPATWTCTNTPGSRTCSCTGPAGELDPPFGGTGVVTHDGAGGASAVEVAFSLAVDAMGRVVVAGVSDYAGPTERLTVWRYQADGSLDPSFAGGDGVFTDSTVGVMGRAVAIDSSGRIVVAGSGKAGDGYGGMYVWRLTPAGALDTTFGTGGRFIHQGAAGATGPNTYSIGSSVAIDSSGRILVGGQSINSTYTADAVLWRLTPSGALDTSFNTKGFIVSKDVSGGHSTDVIGDIAIDGSGRIAATGWSVGATTDEDFVVWRFTSSGALDTSFGGGDGHVVLNNLAGGAGYDLGRNITIDSGGRILAVAYSAAPGGLFDFALVRLTASGTLDSSLAGTGIVHTHAGASGEAPGGVAVDALGRIVVVGNARDASGHAAPMARRYLENGEPDQCFGTNGAVIFDVANPADPPGAKCGVWDGALAAGGGIVAAGCRANGANVDMAIYRLR